MMMLRQISKKDAIIGGIAKKAVANQSAPEKKAPMKT
jgi:hypothetical protein